MDGDVTVIIGAGGMGLAIARRCGSGRTILLADASEAVLDANSAALRNEGHQVRSQPVDVSARDSVAALAEAAAALGPVAQVVHTAGLSPAQAPVRTVLDVNLLGTALVLEEFAAVIAAGGAGVAIASMAAHGRPPFSPEVSRQLATAPADQLLSLPVADAAGFTDPGSAYAFAKRANVLRVQAASTPWGARGARINSISPGVIATPMSRSELDGERGAVVQRMIESSNAGRAGTSADIAEAAAFLLGPGASFVSGADLLVDGGTTAAGHHQQPG
ncbi:SDR family oxidoreductase [Salinifilum ghardaiensis]